jgi:predicted transposase YbfD/YdcC
VQPKTILHKVRGHWSIEVCHYIIDWIYDEDRSIIRNVHEISSGFQ